MCKIQFNPLYHVEHFRYEMWKKTFPPIFFVFKNLSNPQFLTLNPSLLTSNDQSITSNPQLLTSNFHY